MGDMPGDIASGVAAAGWLTFVLVYHRKAGWRYTPMGRHVMTFMVVCGVILTYAFIAAIFGPLPFREWVRFIVFSLLAWLGWWRVIILIREQAIGRKRSKHRGSIESVR